MNFESLELGDVRRVGQRKEEVGIVPEGGGVKIKGLKGGEDESGSEAGWSVVGLESEIAKMW